MNSRRPSHPKMEGLRNDLLLTAYGQPENNEANTSSTLGPRAQKVFFDREDTSFLPTPPGSPVLAELTTAGLDIKPAIAKLNSSIQEGAQAVPNLEMNQSFTDDTYLNTVYSPFKTTSPFYEGTFSDDPFGASNNVLVKQEPDVFSDVYNMCDAHQFVGWGSQTVSVFEAAQVKDEYSEIPSPAPSSPFNTTSSMGSYGYQTDMLLLPEFSTGFPVIRSREHLNSGGEDTEFDSGSEASFSLTTADSEDSLDDISPFDPNNPLHLCDPSARSRTHNYRRNTIDHSVATLKSGDMIPPVSMQSVKKARGRGRPRKFHGPTDGDGRSVNGQTRRGRGRREAMKGNHLWEFIRDLLKDSSYCPKFIRWEEKDDGVFRFVNSEAVASMWGRKKNNPAMTYEKLSRAMRYYYKRDILERVDGRRLVYKFGKNAVGWKQAAGLSSDKIDE